MNRTIKEATVKRFHYESHDQLRTHLADFMAAYNFARRLKTLSSLTLYEYIAKIWTSQPDRFIIDPIHQMPELNNYAFPRSASRHIRAGLIGMMKWAGCERNALGAAKGSPIGKA